MFEPVWLFRRATHFSIGPLSEPDYKFSQNQKRTPKDNTLSCNLLGTASSNKSIQMIMLSLLAFFFFFFLWTPVATQNISVLNVLTEIETTSGVIL